MANNAKVRPLSNRELAAFCTQSALLLHSGISAAEGLSMMMQDSEDADGRAILSEALAHCELGEPLSAGLAATGAFPQYLLDMAAIGEESGRLDEVMEALAAYYDREEALHGAIRSAVRYPLVMIAMMVVVLGVLLARVLPVFNEVFLQLGAQPGGISLSILQIGQAFSRYSAVLLAIVVVAALFGLWCAYTKKGRAVWGKLSAGRVLGSRKLAATIASARFASGMSLMLASGLDTDKSLAMVRRLVQDATAQKKIDHCRKLMEEGQNFGDALVAAGLFRGVYARMLTIGFRTGNADAVMGQLAEHYQQEADAAVSRTVSMIEPTLVAIFSILIGFILLSVMLPLMGIMSSIG